MPVDATLYGMSDPWAQVADYDLPLEPDEPPKHRARTVTLAAVAVCVLAAVGLIGGQRIADKTTPAASTSTASPTPSPALSRDSYGESACRDLETLEASNYGWDTAYIMKLEAIAIAAARASHEDVREQGDALRETLRPDTIPASEMIHIEQQTVDLIRACDDANYAF